MITTLLAAAFTMCAANDTVVALDAITIQGQSKRDYQMNSSQSGVLISRDFLETNLAGSLMQTLEGIPGVTAMSIGSGQSKPIIRGLGFNRMVVTEDGIKHEGQQWGDDHGLEIDQFAIDRAEVLKGPAALLYGSDAIGGVVNLYTNHVPTKTFEGAAQLFGRSNNEQLGISAKIGGRSGKFFYRANFTVIDYADYKVPTDSIQYYSYYIKLKDQRLRNTAGAERDGSVMFGYAGYNFHTDVRISDSYSKSGFFANAHGLEVRLSEIDYDHSRRDISLPYQWVNHLKVLSHTTWRNDALNMELNMAYQNNVREELSEPVSHGYMPKPDNSLERRFNKSTWTVNLKSHYQFSDKHKLSMGLSCEHQNNKRSGWGFIIPDFRNFAIGGFVTDRYTINQNLIVNAGVRYDYAHTHISDYQDWFMTPISAVESVYKQRSATMTRNFNSFTWSTGINYSTGKWVLKANIGKSFRMPIPKELGADGVNYHIFRYERGNASLDPEVAYQLDAGINWSNDFLSIQIDPYLNYFPNYIYLNPTSDYVEGLQLYEYNQAKVIRCGFEAQADYDINSHWNAQLKGEYLFARQLSGLKKYYTLPFSTPWSVDLDVKYSFDWHGKCFASLNAHVVGKQTDIVPPEKPTDGYWTLNASFGKHMQLGKAELKLAVHADNLLNKRYYNHTSYYRLIDVPEPGRNVSFMLGVDF